MVIKHEARFQVGDGEIALRRWLIAPLCIDIFCITAV